MTGRWIAVALLLAGVACAQIASGPSDVARRLRIRIAFADHTSCDSSTRLLLIGNMGFAVAEGSVNGECVAEFSDVPSGRYRVSVKGGDATNADDGDVEVGSVISQELEVRARRTQGSDPLGAVGVASFVSVADLKMPANAAKEFEKASRLIEKQDWEKAYERLRKGLGMYSNFAAGYNNLGAVSVYLGKVSEARDALKKALALDDRLAPAYVNLARISFREKDYPGAESLLAKAISLGPIASRDEFILLAYAQITDKHLNEAIATCRQGHALQLKQHSFLHLVAANAYEQQSRINDAVAELQQYLGEEPSGPQAEKVKSAIATLRKQIAMN